MNIFLSILFILTLISTSFAQEKTEKYIIQFSEHVFVDNLSKSYVYSIHDLMPGKRNDLRSLVELSEQSRLLFHKMIPEAIAGDVVRVGRRTGKMVIVPDLSLWYYVELTQSQYSFITQELQSNNLKFITIFEKWIEPQISSNPPNDPMYHDFRPDNNYVQWELRRIQAEEAWEITTVNTNLRIGIIDLWSIDHSLSDSNWNGEQVLTTHPDLSNGVLYNNGGNYGGHGVYVAGIVGGVTNNGIYLASLGHGIKMYGYSYYDSSDYYRALNVDNVDIISMSLVGGSSFMRTITESALIQEIVVVASSGNGFNNPCSIIPCSAYPAANYFPNINGGTQVIAVSATNIEDKFVEGWNYSPGSDPHSNPTSGFVDIAAPGKDMRVLWSNWDISSSSIGHWINDHPTGGTSFSAPLVSATVALILSVNNSLLPKDVYEILVSSTDKVGQYSYDYTVDTRGWNRRMGYGRLNALKAVYRAQRMRVEEEMASYKSLDESATATNQGRRIVHDGSSSHIVFESGGEIVYFKRLSNGTLSTPILLSQLQDTLIGRNGKPSITLSGSTIHVVWQKKRYGHDVYDIVHRYSTNGGSSWSSMVYAKESLAQTWDPIPALAGSVVSWSPHLMLTYRGPDGIHALVYNFSTNLFGPYATGNSLMLADTLATSPALAASYYGSNNKQHIAWSDNGASIRYSMFTASSGTWSTPVNLSSIVSGSASHLTPSISGNINGNIHLVWHRSTGSGQYQNIIYHRRKHSSDGTWPNQYSATYYQYQGTPSIKSVNSSEAMLAWSQLVPSTHCTYKQPYNSNGQWGNVTQLSCGGAGYPSVSLYGENRAVWTSGTVLPSDIVVSSSTLKDQAQEDPLQIRSLSWRPSTASGNIELRLAPPLLIVDGMQIVLPWAPVHPDTNITLFNLSDFLKPDLSSVDNGLLETGNIRFRVQIMAEESKDLNGIDLNFISLDRSLHTLLVEADFGKTDANYTIDIPARSISSNKSVHIRPTIQPGSELALGSLFLDADGWQRLNGSGSEAIQSNESREAPTMYSLGAYPNPFNPTTQIRFSIPESGSVHLTVHDILGREVAILVNGTLPAGEHQATFDATNLSSGVYLYTLRAGNTVLTGKLLLVR